MLPPPHSDTTPRLGLPLLHAGQARKHITHNAALLAVERHLQPFVEASGRTAPPEHGTRFIVAGPATGAWGGHEGEIAERLGGDWTFHAPEAGWTMWDRERGAHIVFDGAAWKPPQGSSAGSADTLGVGGAEADDTNRLSVRSSATLLTHADGGDHRLAINRQSETGTASVVFQTHYSGGAELGLVGSGDFEFKVSADGGAWHTAIGVERSSGRVTFPSGGPRTPATSAVTIHVAPSGNDSNGGLSGTDPVATLQRAVEILGTVDAGGHAVSVQLAAGTYSGSFKLDRLPVGAGTVALRGAGAASRIVPTGNFPAVEVSVPGASLLLRDIHAEGFIGVRAQYGSVVLLRSTVSLGVCRGGVLVADGGKIDVVGTVELAGGSAALKGTNGGTVGITSSTARLADGTAWTAAFAHAERLGRVVVNRLTVEGTASGRPYRTESNSIVQVVDASTLPGDAAGLAATGGLYL